MNKRQLELTERESLYLEIAMQFVANKFQSGGTFCQILEKVSKLNQNK